MRYIDLCPSAQMLARKEVIENTKEFRKFRLESETILENLIKDDCSIELSFSTGATLLEFEFSDSRGEMIAFVKNGIVDVQYCSFSRMTNGDARKAGVIKGNIVRILKKDLLRIDKKRAIMFSYAPTNLLEKYDYNSIGRIIN